MKSYPSWMGELLHNNSPFASKPINTLIIPGTHDSGTFGMGVGARTQSLNIREQLDLGVRFFDCRIKIWDDAYYFHHTFGSNNYLCKKSADPTKETDQIYALKQMRDFLISNPNEIVILKFQNFLNFDHDDYLDLINLLKKYLEFDITSHVPSRCRLVKNSLLNSTDNQIIHLNQMSIKSLNQAGERVFVFFDKKNVPADTETAKEIWNWAWQYSPVLRKDSYGLWDPYWGDDNKSIADDNVPLTNKWWKWHERNLESWAQDGFFVLQSHMQELPGALPSIGTNYYNISDQVADATYNLDKENGQLIHNNTRNINHYLELLKQGKIVNIVIFDFIQHGNVCDSIVEYYIQ